MAETINKYYAMDDSLLQYGQEGGETNPNATTMQDMQAYMKQNGDTLANVVDSILWQPTTNYVVGKQVYSPNLPAGYIAVCTVAGQSGQLEPEWSTTYSTFTDGTVTWKIENLSSGKVNVSDYNTDMALKANVDGSNLTDIFISDIYSNSYLEASCFTYGFINTFKIGRMIILIFNDIKLKNILGYSSHTKMFKLRYAPKTTMSYLLIPFQLANGQSMPAPYKIEINSDGYAYTLYNNYNPNEEAYYRGLFVYYTK